MGFRAAQVICLLAVFFNLVMAGRDTSLFATAAIPIGRAYNSKLNFGHHMKRLNSQTDRLRQKVSVLAGEQVVARKLQQEEIDCFYGSCPAGQFCNMDYTARRRLQQQADGFCESCFNSDPGNCYNRGLPPAGEVDCDSSCSSTPSYDSLFPPLSSSTFFRWRCCNFIIVEEEFSDEECAGEPFSSYGILMDQMPSCSDNVQMRCPAGGTGDVMLRAYPSGTDCMADEFIDIPHPQCVAKDDDFGSESRSDDSPPPACMMDCPGFAELWEDVEEDIFATCTAERKLMATSCLNDCDAIETIIVTERVAFCMPVNETDHTVTETECFIPNYNSPSGDPVGQTPAASCSSQEANEHWQPEWASEEPASRGTFEVTSGCGCRSDGDCIYTTNYPDYYSPETFCEVVVHSDAALSVVAFNTEPSWDQLSINFVPYDGCGDGLNGTVLAAGNSLSWNADSSTETGGFKICAVASMSDSSSNTNAITPDWADCGTDYSTDYPDYVTDCDSSEVNTHWTSAWNQPSNDTSTNAMKGTFEVTSGCGCRSDGDCIYTTNYPEIHDSDSSCRVMVHSDAALSVVAFNTEPRFDQLSINGNSAMDFRSYSGCGSGLDGTAVSAGDSLSWVSDRNVATGGFKVCAVGSMSDSSSDTNATTPYWAQCTDSEEETQPIDNNCDSFNSSAVNTHWTSAWNQPSNDASTNAMKGTFEVTSGCGCRSDGDCIYTTNYPEIHDSDSSCRVMVHSVAKLSVVAFDTEPSWDELSINRITAMDFRSYSGCGRGLNGTVVSAGDALSWVSDSSKETGGFKICAAGSMSASSSDTNAATPFGGACCDSAAVNTHWTPEWDRQPTNYGPSQAQPTMRGAFEVLTTDGCGCYTDGDCVYSNNFGDGDYNLDDHCTVLVQQSMTLAVMAFQAPAVNLTEAVNLFSGETFVEVGESGHYMTVQIGWTPVSYHSGDGSSLDGLVLPEGANLEWKYGGSPLNITGKGFAICAAATPDWSAMRDWAPPSTESSPTLEAPNPETMPAEVFVAVTTAFSALSMEAMLNKTFRSGFLSSFKNSTAAAAGVPTSFVTVHEIRAGSVIVDASVQIPNPSQRASFHSLLSTSDTSAIYSALAQDLGQSEVIAVTLLTIAPTAGIANLTFSDTNGGTTTVPRPCTLSVLVAAALVGLCSSALWW
eukprot:CAMPEP_0198230160 /NCGR_PEP_ID=MMETSP1445-20131203/114511_1 /TAXON_ID=36898 /ORGANISM="Pyramimonas sp., Strain CCMP2087" /LENGTH=1167 /DNA_ID=CAMNT_0043910675 /DNA_START=104 /DNA_END=3607 /DNA_ORIENTATION=-